MGLFRPPNIEKLKTKKDVRGLIKALGYHQDWRVRRDAAQALGEFAEPRAVEPLINMLADNDKNVRDVAATALFRINTPAVEPLISAFNDGSGYVCLYAAIVLGMIGDSRAVASLITACSSDIEYLRLVAIGALTQIRPPAVMALVTVLGNQHEDAREAASEALVKIGASSVKPLIAALRDKDSKVRRAATGILVQIGKPSVKPLFNALKSKDKFVRKAVAGALGKIGDTNAVDPLIITLSDKVADVRQAAAHALGEIGEVRAVTPLVAILKDKVKGVRRAAAQALDKIGWQPDKGADGAAYFTAKGAWDHCVQIGTPAVEPLVAALEDEDNAGREAVVAALGKIGDSSAVEPLISALNDGIASVKVAAAVALGQIGDTCAVQPLIALLGHEYPRVQQAAADALYQITNSLAVEPLINALGNKQWNVRHVASKILEKIGWEPDQASNGAAFWIVKGDLNQCVQIGSPAVEPLITALKFLDNDGLRDRQEQVAVVEALGQIGDPRSAKPLVDKLYTESAVLYSTWDIRWAAAKALIAMYNSDQLPEKHNALILKHRSAIVKRHHDEFAPSDCIHDDTGIGATFPV